MDTLDFYNGNTNRTARLVTNFGIAAAVIFALSLIYNPPIMADDLILAHAPVPPITLDTGQIYQQIIEEVTPEARVERFNQKARERYPGAVINDVDVGVKHVKLTKYYGKKRI